MKSKTIIPFALGVAALLIGNGVAYGAYGECVPKGDALNKSANPTGLKSTYRSSYKTAAACIQQGGLYSIGGKDLASACANAKIAKSNPVDCGYYKDNPTLFASQATAAAPAVATTPGGGTPTNSKTEVNTNSVASTNPVTVTDKLDALTASISGKEKQIEEEKAKIKDCSAEDLKNNPSDKLISEKIAKLQGEVDKIKDQRDDLLIQENGKDWIKNTSNSKAKNDLADLESQKEVYRAAKKDKKWDEDVAKYKAADQTIKDANKSIGANNVEIAENKQSLKENPLSEKTDTQIETRINDLNAKKDELATVPSLANKNPGSVSLSQAESKELADLEAYKAQREKVAKLEKNNEELKGQITAANTQKTDIEGKHDDFLKDDGKGRKVAKTSSELDTVSRKELRDARREAKKQNESDQIKNETTEWGGKYGGFSKTITDGINAGVQQLSSVMGMYGAARVAGKSADNNVKLAEKGATATTQDQNQTVADNIRESAKQNNYAAIVDGVGATAQMGAAIKHLSSKGKVSDARDRAISEIRARENEIKADTFSNPGNKIRNDAELKALAQTRETIYKNETAEKNKQNEYMLKQTFEFAKTGVQMGQKIIQAKALESKATTLANAAVGAAGGVTIDMSAGTLQGGGLDQVTPGTQSNAITSTGDNSSNPSLEDRTQYNPNDDSNFKDPIAAGTFQAGNSGPSGSAGAGGGGSAGGTSAAKDDSETPNGPKGKDPVAAYAGNDSGSAGVNSHSGSSGSEGVGIDSAFADLLKKFLPGNDEKKESDSGSNSAQDRTPASDQAAVIAKTKNIFEEVHKRYQKKNSEGAVLF